MDKVLWLGVYRDQTGYAEASLRYAQALDQAGMEVVCRPIKLNTASPALPDRILQLEKKSFSDCNIVVQHILPHLMDYNGHFELNIGAYCSETDSLVYSTWADRLNQMDMAWGCSRQMRQAAQNSGVQVPYAVVPIPADLTFYQQTPVVLPAIRKAKQQGLFLFYTIGEFVRRKNLAALLKAFHAEFSPEEPVGLVIKTSKGDYPADVLENEVRGFCQGIQRGLKLYGRGQKEDVDHYRQEIILTQHLNRSQLLGLHVACDCFVQTSYGESSSIPALDSMGLGKTPIVPAWGGYLDYLTSDCGWLVPVHSEPVFGIDDSLSDLYTARENWASVNIQALRRAMREAYQDRDLRRCKSAAGKKRIADFSFEKIGQQMCEVIAHAQRRKPGLARTTG